MKLPDDPLLSLLAEDPDLAHRFEAGEDAAHAEVQRILRERYPRAFKGRPKPPRTVTPAGTKEKWLEVLERVRNGYEPTNGMDSPADPPEEKAGDTAVEVAGNGVKKRVAYRGK